MKFAATKTYKQKKFFVTFKETPEEQDLYDWIKEESKIGGPANYFKRLALEDRRKKESSK